MRVLLLIAAFQLSIAHSLAAGGPPDFAAAVELVKQKRYPEAREVLETIVRANPQNAAACHQLGLVVKKRNDNTAYEEALKWLEKAAELEPNNAAYLGDFGGTLLQYAGRSNSLSAATRGRDAMEKALAIDPDYLNAREGLYQFYQRAPWPLGSSAKAAAQLAEIRRRDPDLATALSATSKANAKEFDSAFQLCDEVLTRKPDNYMALYHYGRTASICGQNLPRGLECLQKCLAMDPPTPASPTHSNVWQRIGILQEQLHNLDAARQAYQAALKLDPSNQQASEALAKLK